MAYGDAGRFKNPIISVALTISEIYRLHMKLRQLECFRALMTQGTMTRAAELLNMTQPGVSSTIAALEHSVGLQLFVRKGSRLQPTAEARLFYAEASRTLDSAEKTVEAAREIRAGRRGYLSIVAYPNISIDLLPRLMSQFGSTRPELHLKLITRQSQTVKELLATQTFDIAITELPTDYPASHMDVIPYECLCMLPVGHPLAEREQITPNDLDGVAFVTLFRGDPLYQRIAAAFSNCDASWNVAVETEFLSSACKFVEMGHGVGIIDPLISAPFTKNLVLKRFVPAITYEIAILYPIHEELSHVAQAFAELLKTRLSALPGA